MNGNYGRRPYAGSSKKGQSGANYKSKRKKRKSDWKNIFEGKDRTSLFHPDDIELNKGYAVAASLGLPFFVPLAAAPESRFGKYWANQGLILDLVMVIALIVNLIVGGILKLFALIPVIGVFFTVVRIVFTVVLWLFILILVIRNCVCAAKGKAVDLPVIGYFRFISYKL